MRVANIPNDLMEELKKSVPNLTEDALTAVGIALQWKRQDFERNGLLEPGIRVDYIGITSALNKGGKGVIHLDLSSKFIPQSSPLRAMEVAKMEDRRVQACFGWHNAKVDGERYIIISHDNEGKAWENGVGYYPGKDIVRFFDCKDYHIETFNGWKGFSENFLSRKLIKGLEHIIVKIDKDSKLIGAGQFTEGEKPSIQHTF